MIKKIESYSELADPQLQPRYSGIPTFFRLPHTELLDEVDIGLVGVPFDGGVTNRSGARHGPRDIRNQSSLIRKINQATGVAPFELVRVADLGDAWIERPFELHAVGVTPLSVGGDHSISLPILRAIARDGPLGIRGYVVTVRHGSTTAYKEVRTPCEGAPKMLAMGERFVVYSIMDFIVDNYFPVLQELESEVDALEDAIFSRTSDRPNVERIYEIRHELLLLRRAVQPLQEMCNRMMRFDVPLIDQAMHPYFRDIQDHVIRLVESIDNLRDLLAAALEAHLLLSSVEQNGIIKIFS
ncbi:MAG TPA: CorA family divalent cation transporter, partial [Stellaceae bacterium]|nr:CorA family divalent cation transporter [Stellaceae bacterium]